MPLRQFPPSRAADKLFRACRRRSALESARDFGDDPAAFSATAAFRQ